MSYEINIIAINQEKPIHIKDLSAILLQNEVEDDGVNRYAEIWPFFSNTKGILYSLVTKINDSYYSAYKLCDSEFDTIRSENTLPNWLPRGATENLTPLIIKEQFFEAFIKIMCFILENAPQNRILFQTRYQGGDEEVVLGVIKFDKFVDMLLRKQILFNVCYILEKNGQSTQSTQGDGSLCNPSIQCAQ